MGRRVIETYFTEHGPSVVGGLLFLIAAWIFALWIERLARHLLASHGKVDSATSRVLSRTIRITIIVLSSIAVLDELGVDIASLIAALGIFGFAIAIGLRTTTNNFFSGVIMLILKPYGIGDYIEGERVEGVVESMSYFHTVVVSDDGTYVAVPNGAMWARSVRNFSRRRPRRVELDIVVGRSKPFEEYSQIIEQTFRDDVGLFKDFAPLVRIADISENELSLQAAIWCDGQQVWDAGQRLCTSLRDNLTSASVEVRRIAVVKKSAPKKTGKKKKSADPVADSDI